jgi:mannose-6-phosphate isomerase-like protein (cupin superfamily)
MEKDETWYVHSGNYIYRWIDTESAKVNTQYLGPGDIVRQRPGQPHQLEAEMGGEIFEISTHHEDSDSYRVWVGDSQTKIS